MFYFTFQEVSSMSEKKNKILVADDEKEIRDILKLLLSSEGYEVTLACDGQEVLDLADDSFDMFILDVNMPKISGFSAGAKLREKYFVPMIFLTAYAGESDKAMGFAAGADDYLTKPFGGGELLARIRTALRHTRTQAADPGLARTGIYRCGRLRVDFDSHLVWLGEENVHLTQSEYRIVALLTQYAGKVLTYDFIIREIWGPNAVGDTQNLRANMAKIRRKLEKNPAKPQYIFTEVGVGYRMAEGD